MRTITVFYDGSHYIYRWLKALMAAKKEFLELGYVVKYAKIKQYFPIFKSGERENLKYAMSKKYDIVFLAFHHSTSELCLGTQENRKEILLNIKKHCNKLVWLDTADSAGCCLFDVMPYVDLYLKKQVYKDKSLYLKSIYGSRLFCDYYHNLLSIEDEKLTSRDYPPLTNKNYIGKIRLSWNVGLGDLFAKGAELLIKPFSLVEPEYIVPLSSIKNLDVHFRGSGWSPIAGYQRTKCKELVNNLEGVSHPDVNTKVPYKEYVKEVKRAKAVLSPFGWGEICGRDFESFVYGATLLKPSMESIETYPNWYKPGKTYIPIEWDFSNFYDVIKGLNSDEYVKIAQEGFKYFRYYRTKDGRLEFAKHIINEISIENEKI